jgi:hypothetical protein
MAFLSLSKGDPAARALLQRAIRARYGLRPVPVDNAHFELVGKGKGPLRLPVSIAVSLLFITATHWRWDQKRKLFGITLGQSSTSFHDGEVYQRVKGIPSKNEDPQAVVGLRRRLWCEVSLMLTPLTGAGVILKSISDQSFQAMQESMPDDVVVVSLNPDDTVAYVETECYRSVDFPKVVLRLKPEGGLQTLEGFTVPNQIVYQWGNELTESYRVVKAEANTNLSPDSFKIE